MGGWMCRAIRIAYGFERVDGRRWVPWARKEFHDGWRLFCGDYLVFFLKGLSHVNICDVCTRLIVRWSRGRCG